MKGTYRGPMAVQDLYQAFYQDREFFLRHKIMHIKNASLYFNPCNEHGEPVNIFDTTGKAVTGYVSAGAYNSAADLFDACSLEPSSVINPHNVKGFDL